MRSEPAGSLPVVPSPAAGAAGDLLPPITTDTAPFHEELARGRLALQRCGGCGAFRHPIAPVCAWCGDDRATWEPVRGTGRVFSWVRYHRAYVPHFAPLVPYVVLTVELDEGPRLYGRLADGVEPVIGMPVRAIVERWSDGVCVLAFVSCPDGEVA